MNPFALILSSAPGALPAAAVLAAFTFYSLRVEGLLGWVLSIALNVLLVSISLWIYQRMAGDLYSPREGATIGAVHGFFSFVLQAVFLNVVQEGTLTSETASLSFSHFIAVLLTIGFGAVFGAVATALFFHRETQNAWS